jgi:hypothetical protein
MYPKHKAMLSVHRGMGIATRMHRRSAGYGMAGGAVKKMEGGAVKKIGRKPLSFRF